MRKIIGSVQPRALRRALLIGTVGIAASACSSDVTRFSQPLFGGSYDTQYTGSINQSAGQGVASGGVERRNLDAPGGGNTQMAAAAPTGQPPTQRSEPSGNGQQTVTVGQGDTAYSIARQHGIPHTALMEANGLSDPTAVRPGQRLVIPSLDDQAPVQQAQQPSDSASADRTTAPRDDSASERPVASTQSGDSHRVERGDTVFSIARAYNVQPDAIVQANGLDSPNSIRVGQSLAIPGATDSSTMTARADSTEDRARQTPEPEPVTGPAAQDSASGEPAGEAREESTEVAQAETPEPTPASLTTGGEQESADSRSGVSEPASAGTFRWPVRGRVISAFADTSNGQRNDGVNISVPEGTSVRAAEDGVVAYAGDELEGFGNLVLIRHEDEWVTAYAHNSSLEVSRGDQVSRGQVIAKAGQTGSVNSPQLHFELRRGSQPVDPLQHLDDN